MQLIGLNLKRSNLVRLILNSSVFLSVLFVFLETMFRQSGGFVSFLEQIFQKRQVKVGRVLHVWNSWNWRNLLTQIRLIEIIKNYVYGVSFLGRLSVCIIWSTYLYKGFITYINFFWASPLSHSHIVACNLWTSSPIPCSNWIGT